MVYLKHWSEFKAQALDLCKKSPNRTRFFIKARPKLQVLVIKVTDDHVTLKFRSKSAIILNRLDEFQREIFTIMSGVVPPAPTKEEPTSQTAETPTPSTASQPPPKGSSGKKKKGKKK